MTLSLNRLLLPLCLLVIFSAASHADTAPPLANAVVLIIRHAEKPDDGSGLTPAGQQRAQDYVHYFRIYSINSASVRVDHLIASADTKHSQRPRLTLLPLSESVKLPLDLRFRDKDVDALASALKTQPNGKTILICWHHSEIPALLQDLGAKPETLLPQGKWPSGVYNWVIQLKYDSAGHLLPGQARRINEHLFPGDAD